MGKKKRIYWRERGGESRAYGDFRDYADVGGGQEALIPRGSALATTDPDVARALVDQRVKQFEEARRHRNLLGRRGPARLKAFVDHHVKLKRELGRVTASYVDKVEAHLGVALEFFGEDREVDTLTVVDVRRYMHWLLQRSNGRGGTLAGATVRRYLVSLSNLFRRAESEAVVPSGFNPVSSLMDKPRAVSREAEWLEVEEAARLLDAARTFEADEQRRAYPYIYPMLATFLLTGGRRTEVRGLEVSDVNFDRETVTFRPNEWRGLKTATSRRSVPLWPQLKGILRTYVEGPRRGIGGKLLFPSVWRNGEERMLNDQRKLLDRLGEKAGITEKSIRTKMFRHTYCATRLQTLDHGHPVAPFTVARELGHGGTHLVERVYGHLGTARHRSEVVEYLTPQKPDAEKGSSFFSADYLRDLAASGNQQSERRGPSREEPVVGF